MSTQSQVREPTPIASIASSKGWSRHSGNSLASRPVRCWLGSSGTWSGRDDPYRFPSSAVCAGEGERLPPDLLGLFNIAGRL